MIVKDLIVKFIEANHIKQVYGVSGANIEDVFAALTHSVVAKPVLAKTEYQAALMAMGSYLATKKPHVVLTTSGAGILNTLPVLAEAFSSRIPFVLITGLVPQALQGKGGFQDTSGQNGTLSLEALLESTTGFVKTVNSGSEMIPTLLQAFALAQKSKKPAVVLVPKNIFSEHSESSHTEILQWSKPAVNEFVLDSEIKNYLRKTKRPLVILGEELVHCEKRELLKQLVNKLDAKVAAVPCAKGFFDHRDARFLGLTGMMGHVAVLQYLQQTDDVFLIGTRMDFLSRTGLEASLLEKKIIHFSQFSDSSYLPVQYQVVGTLDVILQELVDDL